MSKKIDSSEFEFLKKHHLFEQVKENDSHYVFQFNGFTFRDNEKSFELEISIPISENIELFWSYHNPIDPSVYIDDLDGLCEDIPHWATKLIQLAVSTFEQRFRFKRIYERNQYEKSRFTHNTLSKEEVKIMMEELPHTIGVLSSLKENE